MGHIKLIPKGYVTVTQAAKMLKISRNYVYKMIDSGRFKVYTVTKPYFIKRTEVEKLKGR